jgi:hypothetical protein
MALDILIFENIATAFAPTRAAVESDKRSPVVL